MFTLCVHTTRVQYRIHYYIEATQQIVSDISIKNPLLYSQAFMDRRISGKIVTLLGTHYIKMTRGCNLPQPLFLTPLTFFLIGRHIYQANPLHAPISFRKRG